MTLTLLLFLLWKHFLHILFVFRARGCIRVYEISHIRESVRWISKNWQGRVWYGEHFKSDSCLGEVIEKMIIISNQILGHLRFYVNFYSQGCLYFCCRFHFWGVFIFGVIFIFGIVLIFGLPSFFRSSSFLVLIFGLVLTFWVVFIFGVAIIFGIIFAFGSSSLFWLSLFSGFS